MAGVEGVPGMDTGGCVGGAAVPAGDGAGSAAGGLSAGSAAVGPSSLGPGVPGHL